MNLNEYQNLATRTAGNITWKKEALAVWALGLTGEAGEVADIIKKYIGHGHDLSRDKLLKEAGDVLWYLAVLSWELGFTLDQVADANIAKLRIRYPDGFSTAGSLNHADESCDENPEPVVAPPEGLEAFKSSRSIACSLLEDLYGIESCDSSEFAPPDSIPYLAWMCYQINNRPLSGLPDGWSVDKANRWIGYIQGVMVAKGWTTVDQERDRVKQFKSSLTPDLEAEISRDRLP